MNALIQTLVDSGVVVTDGAWGTQLQRRGLPVGACPDAWNLIHPDDVAEVARAYVQAGSRIILSNTFGANRIRLLRHGLEDNAAEINRVGAEISCRAARPGTLVFASMGPTGAMLAAGEVEPDAVREAFGEQAQALAEGGADAIVVETMSDLEEAVIATKQAAATGLPVVACMSYGSGRYGDRTMMGVSPAEAAEALAEAGASVIGANCGQGAAQMLEVVKQLKSATSLPVWVKPNAGMPELVDGAAVYRQTPEAFADEAMALVEAGAAFVGGCCGTSPDTVRALVARLRKQ